jgi:hypothetical protein
MATMYVVVFFIAKQGKQKDESNKVVVLFATKHKIKKRR